MKTSLTVLAALLLATGTAAAGGQDGSFGVGAEYSLAGVDVGGGAVTGLGGPSVNYDAGKFHVGGFLGVSDPAGDNNTDFALGGRFYYHVHSTAMSDFGVGGTVGFLSVDDRAGGSRGTFVFIEPGIQIRAFVAANVALSFSAGLSIGAGDASGLSFAGQATGAAGIHYYFF